MSENKVKTSAGEKISSFVEKNRIAIIVLASLIFAGIIVFVIVDQVAASNNAKNVAAVEEISFALTDKSLSLEDEELAARIEKAKEKLEPLLTKSGVGGVRANMLAAEIAFNEKNYQAALDYWKAAAQKGKKVYTTSLCYYNMGVCAEQLEKTEEAREYYKNASEDKEFVLITHALFSYGRVLETEEKYAEASEVYNSLFNSYPDDTWASLAKTRLIDLQIQGKIE